MPYCTNCGEEVTDDQRYCGYCGERLDEESDDPSRESRRSRGGRDVPGSRDSGGQTRTGGRESGGRAPAGQPANRDSTHRTDATAGYGSDTGGFEGDPPPKGYEDPPSVRESRPGEDAPREGTIELFVASFKGILSFPVVLLVLFLAWFLASALAIAPPGLGLAGLLFSGVIGLVAAGIAHVRTEDRLRGDGTTAGDAASRVLDQLLPLLGIWLVFVPAFVFGFAFFVLPGLYIGGRLLLAFPACVLDGEGALDSLSTSWDLTRGVGLTSMGVLAFALVSFLALAFALSIPQSIVFSALGIELVEFQTLEEALALMEDPRIVLVNAVFQAIALAIPVGAVQVAAARLYLQERYGGY